MRSGMDSSMKVIADYLAIKKGMWNVHSGIYND